MPALTDHEMPAILAAAAEAGAGCAGYSLLRLPFGVKDLFERWLEENYPDRKDKVLNRIREIRGGRLNDPGFKSRMKGQGIFAEQVEALFDATCRKLGLTRRSWKLSTASFRRDTAQLPLFGGVTARPTLASRLARDPDRGDATRLTASARRRSPPTTWPVT